MTSRTRPRTPVGHARRTRPVRRASARLSPVRAGAALAMLAAAGAIYGVGASTAFRYSTLHLSGIRYTDEQQIRELLAVPDDVNLFALETDPLEARLEALPTVEQAAVSVRLPGTLAVEVAERKPILVWQIRDRAYLVDRDGWLFAELGRSPRPDAAALPRVADARPGVVPYGVGSRLEPIDLDVATRLGSLRPADVGSAAEGLSITLTDEHGFVVRAVPDAWSAIFGFYTPSLRTPEIIPGQVRLLRSLLLEQGERNVVTVTLASDTDGTFTTPRPSRSEEP